MDINQAIADLLKALDITPYQMAKTLGYNNGDKIYNIINRKNKPGFDTLHDILTHYPQINADWLLRGEGTMLKTDAAKTVAPAPPVAAPIALYRPIEEWEENKMIPVVDKPAYASLMGGFADADPESFARIYLADLRPGRPYVAIRIYGDSMHPTIADHDVVVASQLSSPAEIKSNYIYIVVTTDSVYCKRVMNHGNRLQLKSDNRAHPYFSVDVSEVRSVWEVRRRITGNFSGPMDTEQRLVDTEKSAYYLENEVQRLNDELQDMKREIKKLASRG
jgi:phage repressor protein C with HTH and peptisase S24 domain